MHTLFIAIFFPFFAYCKYTEYINYMSMIFARCTLKGTAANVFGHSYRDNDYLTILSMQLIHRNKGEDKKNP